jgi:hypothetical protein
MKRIEINFQSENDIQHQFKRVSELLFSKNVLIVNDAVYRLVDIEYYAYSGMFEDVYTHKNPQQLSNGKFYLHGSGMDITFGDGYNYGGILIRGIVKLKKQEHAAHYMPEKYIDGPWLSASEIISQLNPITQDVTSNTISLLQTETDLIPASISTPEHIFYHCQTGKIKNSANSLIK